MDHTDTELVEVLNERPVYALAKEYGQSPREIRKWSDYDFSRAWLFLTAENGGGEVTQEEIQDNIAARLKGRENEVAILEHTPNYWSERTREQVTAEGYDADWVAQELAELGLAFKGEASPDATTQPLESTEE